MDHEDVYRMLKSIPNPKPSAEEIYPDVMLTLNLLRTAVHVCNNHGRHDFRLVSPDIKQFVENFIGRQINDVALIIGIRMVGLQTKQSKSDRSNLVKVPLLERFEEYRELWNQRQAAEQKQIDEEIKKWAAFRAKHPNYRP
jgi:hypothetical protein